MSEDQEQYEIVKQSAKISFDETIKAMVPQNFEGLWRMATIMATSGMMPDKMNKPETVFVAVQMGLEVGLPPMASVQNIAVINGRPAIWGDAVLGVVRASGQLESFNEYFEGDFPNNGYKAIAVAKRKGEPNEIKREFSIKDAIIAGLWCFGNEKATDKQKYTPWYKYPKRMLQMRARSWALRDGFGDVLRGIQMREEVIDYDIDLRQTPSGTYTDEKPEVSEKPPNELYKPTESQNEQTEKQEDNNPAGNDKTAISDVIKIFEKSVMKYVDYPDPTVDRYIKHLAKEYQKTVDEIKCEHADADVFESFWSAFDEWRLETYQDRHENIWADIDKSAYVWDRPLWINLRTKGFSTYVHANKSTFQLAPKSIKDEARKKWKDLYPESPLPDELNESGFENGYRTGPEWEKLNEAKKMLGDEIYKQAIEEKELDAVVTTEDAISVVRRMNIIADIQAKSEEYKNAVDTSGGTRQPQSR